MYMAWALGLLTLVGGGFADFAKASEVSELKRSNIELAQKFTDRSNDIMGVVIGGQIFDLRFKQCAAIKGGNSDLVRAYSDQMQGSLDQYQKVTGRGYNLQACP